MFKRIKKPLAPVLFLLAIIVFTACDPYQRILRSNDLELKQRKAMEYYNDGAYHRAIPLFEELIQIFRGTRSVEELYYYYTDSHFQEGNYLIAAFHFNAFHQQHPNSKFAEKALYMHAYSYYRMSPVYSLDQTYTQKALDGYRRFVNRYPQSGKIEKVNGEMDQMRRKLEMKAFRSAELYFRTRNYRAAASSFEAFLNRFPETRDTEKVYLYIIRSYYNFAENSVQSRRKERYELVIENYLNFVENFQNPLILKEAEDFYVSALEKIEALN
ncbi:MAG: outer membrane protein assembly factor BamD [Chitinophagaceae bacterium]|nr:MAG: outer membrane protein assembly factor BamD [Chitinophagaceae bacterium]